MSVRGEGAKMLGTSFATIGAARGIGRAVGFDEYVVVAVPLVIRRVPLALVEHLRRVVFHPFHARVGAGLVQSP